MWIIQFTQEKAIIVLICLFFYPGSGSGWIFPIYTETENGFEIVEMHPIRSPGKSSDLFGTSPIEVLACHIKQKYCKWKASSKPSREGTAAIFSRGFLLYAESWSSIQKRSSVCLHKERTTLFFSKSFQSIAIDLWWEGHLFQMCTVVPSHKIGGVWEGVALLTACPSCRESYSPCVLEEAGTKAKSFQHNSYPSWGMSPNPHFNFIMALLKRKKNCSQDQPMKKIHPLPR